MLGTLLIWKRKERQVQYYRINNWEYFESHCAVTLHQNVYKHFSAKADFVCHFHIDWNLSCWHRTPSNSRNDQNCFQKFMFSSLGFARTWPMNKECIDRAAPFIAAFVPFVQTSKCHLSPFPVDWWLCTAQCLYFLVSVCRFSPVYMYAAQFVFSPL